MDTEFGTAGTSSIRLTIAGGETWRQELNRRHGGTLLTSLVPLHSLLICLPSDGTFYSDWNTSHEEGPLSPTAWPQHKDKRSQSFFSSTLPKECQSEIKAVNPPATGKAFSVLRTVQEELELGRTLLPPLLQVLQTAVDMSTRNQLGSGGARL